MESPKFIRWLLWYRHVRLFSYIESQTRLIPMPIQNVLELCGSGSEIDAFSNRLRAALTHLSAAKIIESGWSIKDGPLRWKKFRDFHDSDTAIALGHG